MHPVQLVLLGLGAYLLVGLLVGGWFVFARAGAVDAGARGASLGFRLLILPGAVALWPVLLRLPAGGPRASDDPARRRTEAHRRVHRLAWPLLLPAVAALVVLAVALRSEPEPVASDILPDEAPASAEAAP